VAHGFDLVVHSLCRAKAQVFERIAFEDVNISQTITPPELGGGAETTR
jgi:hypothetical protein